MFCSVIEKEANTTAWNKLSQLSLYSTWNTPVISRPNCTLPILVFNPSIPLPHKHSLCNTLSREYIRFWLNLLARSGNHVLDDVLGSTESYIRSSWRWTDVQTWHSITYPGYSLILDLHTVWRKCSIIFLDFSLLIICLSVWVLIIKIHNSALMINEFISINKQVSSIWP